MNADDIPVAHTPTGGFGADFPEPILAECTESLVEGAVDMRGLWRVTEAVVDGEVVPDHRVVGLVQRIEQCGDRVVVTSGGVVHDMRADGTEEHGVRDVAEIDFTTEITVVATFEDGVHVLRPVGIPIEVRRWRDGDDLMWDYGLFAARLTKLGPAEMAPADLLG